MVPVSRPGSGTSSRRQAVGAALVGLALLGATTGSALGQDASPEASPVAVAAWITDLTIDVNVQVDGDTTTVGVLIGEVAEINSAAFETRPVVQLQLNNTTESAMVAVLLTAPTDFDATGFTLPADVSGLPEGVAPYGAVPVPGGTQVTAVLPNLPEGTYILATTTGQALTFVVSPQTAVDVPDIFATPAS